MAEFFITVILLISPPIFPLPTFDFSHGKPIQVQSIKKETKKHQKKFGYNDKELLSLHPAIGQYYNNNAQELE
jgi:hypothetical protein